MDQRQTLEALAIQIENNRVEAVGGRTFVPPSSLSAIFTRPAIAAAVSELSCADEDRLGLTDDIQDGGVPTFAILVSMRQPGLVINFRRHRCLNRLPLDGPTAKRAAGDYASRFLREQWDFQPYHFRRGHDVEITGSEILPFIRNLGPLTSGGFGDTDKVEIHPSLQDFVPHETRQVVVVRKTLRKNSMVSEQTRVTLFNNEKRCLRLVNHLPHPNIVPLLSSYIHDHSCCMLFPLLDMDLKAFLERPKPYGSFCRTFTYFSALHGLASALWRTHEIRIRYEANGADFDGVGYHHDLRPANVLVSLDNFLLADFGMGSVKSRDDGSATRFKALSSDYVAPECMDEQFAHLTVGRAMDVWAFGCLATEVMTYAYLGLAGLTTFRTARKVLGPSGIVTDTFFHDGQGKIKPEVSEWIDYLAGKECQRALGIPLGNLFRSILRPIDERPQISQVCLRFANLSLKAHFFAVLDTLADISEGQGNCPSSGSLMKLWFERERLRAFGIVLCLWSPTTDPGLPKFVEKHGDKCVRILLELFHKIRQVGEPAVKRHPENSPRPSEPQPASSPSTSASLSSHTLYMGGATLRGIISVGIAADQPAGDAADPQISLDEDNQRLVQDLWDLLSDAESRKAERVWFHSVLDATDSIDTLGQIERALQVQRPATYQHGAALAMMKKLRLEMLSGRGREGNSCELEIPDDAIPHTDSQTTHRHCMGIYKHRYRVLIETMFYDLSWEKIPPQERTLVMAHKAKGFSVKPRPSSLRLLDCVGFFEKGKTGGRKGFSFVYQVPEPVRELDTGIPPDKRDIMTLQSLLILTGKQSAADQHKSLPFLGDKLCLASKLASFLYEFHSIGWLHENLHSNNIVYFDPPPSVCEKGISAATSSILGDPFVVGLNKSRPGGEAWHTQGPAEDAEFLDYRHPAYNQTSHFRVGYDYYSLGIVLLELGLWRPLASIANRRTYRMLSPQELRNALIEQYVPRLGHSMGRTYRDVVMLLLSDRLDPDPLRHNPDSEVENRTFSAFLEEVVDPLERLAGGSV